MPATGCDLYRIGDASGAGLNLIQVGRDVTIYTLNGVDWVRGSPDGGSSTTAAPWKVRRLTSQWWRLPAGSSYPDRLVLRNDHGNHWLWEPAVTMPLSDYVSLLTMVTGIFVL
jgi:hypothetical protein